jgi:hypothetical protein
MEQILQYVITHSADKNVRNMAVRYKDLLIQQKAYNEFFAFYAAELEKGELITMPEIVKPVIDDEVEPVIEPVIEPVVKPTASPGRPRATGREDLVQKVEAVLRAAGRPMKFNDLCLAYHGREVSDKERAAFRVSIYKKRVPHGRLLYNDDNHQYYVKGETNGDGSVQQP